MKKGETLNNIGKEKVITSHTFLDGICWWLSNIFLIFFCIPDKHCVEFHLYYEMRIGRTTLCSGHFYLHPPLGSVHLLMHFWRITISQPAVRFLIYIQPVVDGLPFYFHHSIFLFFIVQQTISLCIERNIQYDWMSQNKRVGKKERIIKTRNDKTGRRVISSRTSASLLSLSLHVCIYIFIFKTYDILIGPPGEVLNNWIEDIFIFFFYMSAFDQSNLSKLSAFAQEEWQNSLQGHWITSFVDLCFVEDRTLD